MSVRTARQAPPSIRQRIIEQNERNARMTAQIAALMPKGLAAFIEDAFEGQSTIVNVGAAINVEAAERAVIAAIEPHFETRLNAQQRASIGTEVVMAWNRRTVERKAGLVATQQALANPFFSIGAR